MKTDRPWLVFFVVVIACLAGPCIAVAGSGDNVPPSLGGSDPQGVQFLGDKPQKVTLTAGEKEAALEIVAINGTSSAQNLHLAVVNLVDGKGAPPAEGFYAIAPPEGCFAVPGGGLCTFKLTFTRVPISTTQVYSGTLVVYDGDGSVDRLGLEVTVEAKADAAGTGAVGTAPAPEPGQGEWNPVRLSDKISAVTMTGANYLPSPLSPLSRALFWLGVALVVVWWFWNQVTGTIDALRAGTRPAGGEGDQSPVKKGKEGSPVKEGKEGSPVKKGKGGSPSKKGHPVLLVVGILFLAAGAALTISAWYGKGPWEFSFVQVKPISVPAGAEPGSLTAANGRLGRLAIEGDLMYARSLGGAGEYSGTVDLKPADETGDVEVTVKVADWWFYALLVVAAGVLTGYAVTSYYKYHRGTADLGVRMAKLRRDIAANESDFQKNNANRPQSCYSVQAPAGQRLKAIEDLLAQDQPDLEAAKAKLDALETYCQDFVRLQVRLHDLDALLGSVKRQIKPGDWGIGEGDVKAHQYAGELLEGYSTKNAKKYIPFQIPPEDEAGTDRTACAAEVEDALKWVQALAGACVPMAEWLGEARGIEAKWDKHGPKPEDPATVALKGHMETLRQSGADALTAANADGLPDLEKAARDALGAIKMLAIEKKVIPPPAWAREFLPKEAAPVPSVTIAVPPGALEPEKLYGFTATVDLPSPATLRWDYGDGEFSTPWPQEKGAGLSFATSHRYKSAGSYAVGLEVGGAPMAKKTQVTVEGKPQWEKLLASFRLTDRQMAWVAGLLAVASGFAAQYLASSSWGSANDYVKAFLWGAVVSEGLKAVANLVGRIWPLDL